jgi:hypothetical protein
MRPIPILALLLATTACGGARVPVVDGVPCDTARVVSLGDTVHHFVHATLTAEDTTAAATNGIPPEYADLVLHAVVNAITIPARLSGPAADSVLEPISLVREPGARSARLVFPDPPSRLGENYSLATAISFGIRADGRLDSLAVARVSSELALTRALVVAALSADSLRLIPPRPAGVDTGEVRLRIALSLEKRPGLAARPIFRAALPRPFDERPAPIQSEVRRPSFWPSATPGQEWHTDIRFVLDESGRPVEESIETLSATDSAWAGATRAAIERTRYVPAVLEGCPVKVRVVQPWSYIVR